MLAARASSTTITSRNAIYVYSSEGLVVSDADRFYSLATR